MAAKKRETKTCSACGTTEKTDPGGMPLGWSFTVDNGRMSYLCAACARANIRSIEAKLPTEYWE